MRLGLVLLPQKGKQSLRNPALFRRHCRRLGTTPLDPEGRLQGELELGLGHAALHKVGNERRSGGSGIGSWRMELPCSSVLSRIVCAEPLCCRKPGGTRGCCCPGLVLDVIPVVCIEMLGQGNQVSFLLQRHCQRVSDSKQGPGKVHHLGPARSAAVINCLWTCIFLQDLEKRSSARKCSSQPRHFL